MCTACPLVGRRRRIPHEAVRPAERFEDDEESADGTVDVDKAVGAEAAELRLRVNHPPETEQKVHGFIAAVPRPARPIVHLSSNEEGWADLMGATGKRNPI